MKLNGLSRLIIGLLSGAIFILLILLLVFRTVDPQHHTIIGTVIGFVGGAWSSVVNYYFGDSEGKHNAGPPR